MSDENIILRCSTCLNDAVTKAWIFEGCLPVPAFGETTSAKVKVATVGINPSSSEFYTAGELKLPTERLPALSDYGATSRDQLTPTNVTDATQNRAAYFSGGTRSAHDWFGKLGVILNKANANWSYGNGSAVHLDIVACVTKQKWSVVDERARKVLAKNCHQHLERTVNTLPAIASLLFDGKTACEAMAGDAGQEWKNLCQFTDATGQRKTVYARVGSVTVGGQSRRFAAWSIPAKYLPDDVLPRVSELVAGTIFRPVLTGV